MRILRIVKNVPEIAEERRRWAAGYRKLRAESPAKARLLFSRLGRAMALTEKYLNQNLYQERSDAEWQAMTDAIGHRAFRR